ncbi:ATP-dependent DNA helicase DinG [Paenalkalicoccus suaedae]|uniref:3'-5' exonuclease DinG n=1 Tax=Paenalkalicoccus suaedae TaxID=2592382 RepID=A0A859FEW2_9BACI|nr:ATP-dependent DNA helicase DinG [Paenalkalicoccus suaedae]QKS71124.1 ATP-dependent DNA helicase DinG [Paenalkalicoccus suaedae]
MSRFVVLDLETTGVSHKKGDRIIQLAYSIVEDNRIVDRYATYLNPKRDIPPFIKQLTQITDAHVTDAPEFDEVAPKLLRDLEGAYFVAHNSDFDLGFMNEALEDAGYNPYMGPVLDTVELSRIAFPTEESFRLTELSDRFNMDHENPHRADSDAEATAILLIEIFDRLRALPKQTLKELCEFAPLFRSDCERILHSFYVEADEKIEGLEEYRGLVIRKKGTHIPVERDLQTFEELMEQSFRSDNVPLQGFERRLGQEEMMSFIHETLQADKIGLIEAGTGTGKSLGYLVPAIIDAVTREQPVVISTETIQLQEQLLKKEIPVLEDILPFTVKTALLKGRSHYLCLHKFEDALALKQSLTYEKVISLAQLLVWLTETDTGDAEELNLASSSDRLWSELQSDGIACIDPSSPWFSRCFYQRAKLAAKHADLIITNHALLLTDVTLSHQVIPSSETIIIDEAHHLEETATKQFGKRLDYAALAQVINQFTVKESLFTAWLHREIPHYQDVIERLKDVQQEWADLYYKLYQYGTRGKVGKEDTGRNSKVIHKTEASWTGVDDIARRCDAILRESINELIELSELLDTDQNKQSFQREIDQFNRYLSDLEDVYALFTSIFLQIEEGTVYWLEVDGKGPKQSGVVYTSPVDVSDLLADSFFRKKKRVILTSATLTVNKSFDYMMQTLGLLDFDVVTKQVESPFNWEDQAKLYVPTDMPLIQEVGDQAYVEALALQVYRIAQASEGKMLVLFTSYEMLRRAHELLVDLLDETYTIIGQGIHSRSRTRLTKNFQQVDKAILLGTSSFWEGVDIPGEDLSVLVMARLPFSPPNDPVFQAKSDRFKENGSSPFMKLALPQAILRFKQGFGRLIRRKTDRGAVIVLDRRIVTTRYGSQFVRSLPVPLREKSMADIEDELATFLQASEVTHGNTHS